MTVRVRIKGKEYSVKETTRNVERTYIIQKKFLDLAKSAEAAKDVDSDEAEELKAAAIPPIAKAIEANITNLNEVAGYIADVIGNDQITVDYLKDNLLYDDFQKLLFKLIDGILHRDEAGAAEGKK